MLVGIASKPKSQQRVNRRCYKCGSESQAYFNNHIASVNDQSRFVEYWHCKTCYQQLDEYKEYIRNKTSDALKHKFRVDSAYVKRVSEARKRYYSNSQDNPRSWNTTKFVSEAIKAHGYKYDYSKSVYVNSRQKVLITCRTHGPFESRPSHHIHYLNGCPECNKEKLRSRKESEIADWIRSCYSGEVIQSDRTVLDGLEIDIWIPSKKLGIEYNGAYFHSFSSTESSYQRNYHSMKSTLAYNNGITLLQFVDIDYMAREEIAKSMILNKLNLVSKVHARQCKVVTVSRVDAKKFFDQNHYSGGTYPDLAYGLIHRDTLVAVLSFTSHKTSYQINRFANVLGHRVVGGFSKLLTAFRRSHAERLFTYVDRCFTTGPNCYSQCGMRFSGMTKPGYRYFKRNKLYNRRAFQKHKLSNKLQEFNPNLTEAENMFNNGYRRLWDAGNLKYEN